MRVVIAAGGTGGHFYPGLAVAHELIKEGIEVRFLVRKKDFVIPILEIEKIDYVTISASGLVRSLSPKNLVAFAELFCGFFQSLAYLLKNRPQILLVMGGYLSFPPALAAKLLGIPVFLHEQNVIPGLANRILGRLANKIAVSFSASKTSFIKPVVVTGNPVRDEFKNLPSSAEVCAKWNLNPKKLTILIFGGSLGAHALNEWIVSSLDSLQTYQDRFQFIHFTGRADEAWVKESYRKSHFQNHVEGYCHDMASAYAVSNLVIARSGASTISELLAVQKPALLIPYPHATENHQVANAKVLMNLEVAQMLEEKPTKPSEFTEILEAFMKNPTTIEQMKKNYQRLILDPFQATQNIVQLLKSLGAGGLT